MRVLILGALTAISGWVFACSPGIPWTPSAAELDELSLYLDEQVVGVDSSTPFHTRKTRSEGFTTFYHPHRTEEGADFAWVLLCMLGDQWRCFQDEARVLILQDPNMFIIIYDNVEMREALKVLTFLREYASSDDQQAAASLSLHELAGTGSLLQIAPQRFEVRMDVEQDCWRTRVIEIKKNCPLEACSYGFVHQGLSM